MPHRQVGNDAVNHAHAGQRQVALLEQFMDAALGRVGGINQAYAWSKTFSDKFSGVVKQWKRKHPKAYRIARPVLAVVVLVASVQQLPEKLRAAVINQGGAVVAVAA